MRRRELLKGLACTAALPLLLPALPRGVLAATPQEQVLRAAPGEARLVGSKYPMTRVWSYGGRVPGPELRLRQGEAFAARLDNALEEGSSLHWHGIRLDNAMDGVPGVTQDAVDPGASFLYGFTPPDAGTYWYHPHFNSSKQVDSGLAGPLIVEEAEPPRVDREETWLLDDWRLDDEAQIVQNFGSGHDASHAGRIGNTVTLNGFIPEAWPVRAGERVRLRLINAANARGFTLQFQGHRPTIVGLDGQPCSPHAAPEGGIVLGPAMRADVIVDLEGKPGERFEVHDAHYPRSAYKLLEIAYSEAAPLRESPLDAPLALPANPLPPLDLAAAEALTIVMAGGMTGGMTGAMLGGESLDPRALMEKGVFWALNGVAAAHHEHPKLFDLQLGRTYRATLVNDTAFEHPMHLHGHHMKLLSRDGIEETREIWHDTLLVAPQQRVELAFTADNPGDWLFHCHILEHQQAGMMALVGVY
ncbi:MAG: multicopper oxidase family protein [Rhodovibrionaceae bacterium]